MAENRPPQRKQRLMRVAQALAFALSGLLALPSYADLRPRARPRIAPPMRFVRVTSAEAACKPNCPEWLSAEGRIQLGTAKAFADAIANLKGRRLPILIHSPGGSVADAGAMGELIRAKGLAVAVARTLITNCPEASPKCPDGPGTAITGGAICASACVLVLAGGVERLAGPSARIGVHQITTVVSETEGLAHLKSTRKIYEQQGVDAAVQAYLAATGVGEPVMTLMRKTSAASIRWLSPAELKDSRLMTLALDTAEPILASGANGLNGHAFDGDPPRPDLVQASVVRTVAGGGATVEVTFRYRPGGGAVEVEAIERGLDSPQAADRSSPDSSVSSAGGGPLQLKTTGATPVRTLIPRERFCVLAHGRMTIASTPPERPQGFAPIELAALDGARALITEACP
ncbi:MAG TPA: hypothetical protein VNY10_13505 [Roseiarcus sp.]|jgi:hypothetical protein|nr:hypothetical protein [Roseiarcus sp.]